MACVSSAVFGACLSSCHLRASRGKLISIFLVLEFVVPAPGAMFHVKAA